MEVSSEEAEQCEMATDLPSNVPSFTTKHSQLLASATKWKVFVWSHRHGRGGSGRSSKGRRQPG